MDTVEHTILAIGCIFQALLHVQLHLKQIKTKDYLFTILRLQLAGLCNPSHTEPVNLQHIQNTLSCVAKICVGEICGSHLSIGYSVSWQKKSTRTRVKLHDQCAQ
jgi:hypothetical protein